MDLVMNTDQINDIFKNEPNYIPCKMRDEIKSIKQLPNNSFFVLNLNTSKQSGSHFCACFINHKNLFYFDSYGCVHPNEITTLAKRLKLKIIGSTSVVQDLDSQACGYYCCSFIFSMKYISDIRDPLDKHDYLFVLDTLMPKYKFHLEELEGLKTKSGKIEDLKL